MRTKQRQENDSPNLEYYKVFYYVATYSSVTKAARALSVSQPAISQQVKQLEKALGVQLFNRSARGVHLTEEGALLFSYIKRAYEEILKGESRLHQMMNLDVGEVRIGASDMTLRYFLLPYLEKYHETYPGVKVHVNNAPTPDTLELLNQGVIDFGIVTGPISARSAGVDAISVRKTQDVFIAGNDFKKDLAGRKVALRELKNYPLILLEDHTSSRSYIDKFLGKAKVSVTPEFELATSDMIVQFTERNLGIGCVTKDFAQDAIDAGRVFALDLEEELPERDYYVVTAKDRSVPHSSEKLLEMIREGVEGKKDEEPAK